MRWLTLWRRPDRGAVALIVAVLMGSLTLVGIAALTVDVGSMSLERRLLQNGADAAAASAVIECATTNTCPDVTNPSDPKMVRLEELANLNATDDGATSVSRLDGEYAVCGVGPGLQPCEAVSGNQLQDCPAPNPPPTQFVRVYTQTKSDLGGNTLLPSAFAEALTGSSAGTRHQACAAYAWGKASISPLLPFTFSACEWFHDTDQDPDNPSEPGDYAPYSDSDLTPPQSDPRNNPWEHAINLNSGADPGCTSWQNHDFPGGFGWLDYDPTTCKIADPVPAYTAGVVDGYWYPGDTGVGGGNQCGAKIEAAVGTVVYLPIFDCADNDTRTWPCAGNLPNGTNAWYHMKGAVAFFLTGVDITGQLTKNLAGYPNIAAKKECQADDTGKKKCFFGWFLEGLQDPTAVIDGSAFNTGLKAIQMIG